MALLHKSADDRGSSFPGQTYPTASVTGMPSAVQLVRTAMRTWISATLRSKSRAMSRWPSSFAQCILVSTRLRQWYPLHLRQSARSRYFAARSVSSRAMAPAVIALHGLAFLRGGMMA